MTDLPELPDFAKERLQKLKEMAEQKGLTVNEDLVVYDVPVELCVPTGSNPNEMKEETFNTLAEEIDEVREGSPGFIEPVHLVPITDNEGKSWYQIVGGEHRWRAQKAIGKKTVPGILLTTEKWKNEEFREFMMVRLNVLRGSLNAGKFLSLYEKHVKTYGNDQLKRLFAFTDEEYWISITGGARDSLKKSGVSDEFLEEFDSKTKEIGTVENLASILNGLFQKYGNDLRYSFMVFVFGGKEHLMVQMNKKMVKHLDVVKKWCRDTETDINEVMIPVVAQFEKMTTDPRFLMSLKSKPKTKPKPKEEVSVSTDAGAGTGEKSETT